MADVAALRRLALALPEAEEGTAYGTPAWRVRKKMFARLRDDGQHLVVTVDRGERELLMGAEPAVFFITDHYRPYHYMLVRLGAIPEDELAEVLEDSWRRAAPTRLVKERDEEATSSR
ncbi:MAG: hypothetical protein QOH58_2411 [Thermoleophilaceae bacterium]|jgi:hypothetical protein|nr:hypothetical protein [Thermoleophilaceae bacterium]